MELDKIEISRSGLYNADFEALSVWLSMLLNRVRYHHVCARLLVGCCVVYHAPHHIGGGIVCVRAHSWHRVQACSLVASCARAAVTAQPCCCINCASCGIQTIDAEQ